MLQSLTSPPWHLCRCNRLPGIKN